MKYDEPQPDVYLLRPKEDFYASGHATPADIFLIVEMSDSSLEYDQQVKKDLYASTGVPEYWIADIRNDCVIAHYSLHQHQYLNIQNFYRETTLTPTLLPDLSIPVEALLP